MDNYKNIPEEMKQDCHFCVANRSTKATWSKSNDISTFYSFQDASKMLKTGYGLGVGLFDNLCGIDIDHCVVDGHITETAKEIISRVNSYTEFSPSKNGVRIFFKCDEQFDHRAQGYGIKNSESGIEIYQGKYDNRYLSVTGDVINKVDLKLLSNNEVQQLFDSYMKKKFIRTYDRSTSIVNKEIDDNYLKIGLKKDPRLIELWNTDARSVIDQSAFDLKLLSKIGYWSNRDHSLMKTAFESSPYFKSKDDYHLQKWGREDYQSQTISIAADSCQKTALERNIEFLRSNSVKIH